MEIDYKLIGQRIKNARKELGWSQERLSEEIDVSTTYINRLERGAQINLKRLAQISNVLDVKIEYLIAGTVVKDKRYLDKELHEILITCSPKKQRLIYNLAKIVSNSNFG